MVDLPFFQRIIKNKYVMDLMVVPSTTFELMMVTMIIVGITIATTKCQSRTISRRSI